MSFLNFKLILYEIVDQSQNKIHYSVIHLSSYFKI
jgi:hypothetical protein